jgi:P27 family predicted phage terminase small subunit
MGKRGYSARPSHLKALEGCREDRLNREEPVPERGAIVPPMELEPEARAVWDRLAPDLIAKRVLTAWDVDAFAAFCRSAALYDRAASEAAGAPLVVPGSHGGCVQNPVFRVLAAAASDMRAFGQRFGLTPGDRASLKVSDDGGSQAGAARLLS